MLLFSLATSLKHFLLQFSIYRNLQQNGSMIITVKIFIFFIHTFLCVFFTNPIISSNVCNFMLDFSSSRGNDDWDIKKASACGENNFLWNSRSHKSHFISDFSFCVSISSAVSWFFGMMGILRAFVADSWWILFFNFLI